MRARETCVSLWDTLALTGLWSCSFQILGSTQHSFTWLQRRAKHPHIMIHLSTQSCLPVGRGGPMWVALWTGPSIPSFPQDASDTR